MAFEENMWQEWAAFFASRRGRALPGLEPDFDYQSLPASLARSLAIFQLGESGGGTVTRQARNSRLPHLDRHYGEAVDLFVSEEHRHADILATCVRLLGGKLIRSNWTARLFVFGRRLIGLRLKMLVLLAAEVVGLVYYELLAAKLPRCSLRDRLLEIAEDERAHLYFHCDFLRTQTPGRMQRLIFKLVWRSVIGAASYVVALDHRHTIRDLEIGTETVLLRWKNFARLAETLVLAESEEDRAAMTLKAFL